MTRTRKSRTCSRLPRTCSRLPRTCSRLPRTCSRLPSTISYETDLGHTSRAHRYMKKTEDDIHEQHTRLHTKNTQEYGERVDR